MAKIAGKTGWVEAASLVAGINTWSLDDTQEALETTDFSASGDATFIIGVHRWSGTFTGYKDGAPLNLSANSVSIWLAQGSASTTAFHGMGYITGRHAGADVAGVATMGYDFIGTGSITSPTA